MFNKSKLNEILVSYKQIFPERMRGEDDEIFKWEAVKCFQNNWNEKADDFARMLKISLSRTNILLAGANYFPRKMIQQFAESAPEEVRSMFVELFDESRDIFERFESFKAKSSLLLERYGNGSAQHFQQESAISTYLWLKYPDKYYIYKFHLIKSVADTLESDHHFKMGDYANNLKNCSVFYDEIRDELKKDTELISMLAEQLDNNCYPDSKLKTLTFDVTFYISQIISQKCDPLPVPAPRQPDHTVYTRENFLEEVYMTGDDYSKLRAVLRNKKNIILQGAPGVGKTFAAKRLAWSMMGEIDESRIGFIQFHQNYSYEDFVMGYKPVKEGFELRYGIFYRFCQEAAKQPDKDFYFIIDEINRGNMSKIFGELLMLIERDYRGTTVTLAYDGQLFSVPKNLYIIGMMNTADRSLAMIDYALRRRFGFFDMKPAFDSDGFKQYQERLNNETLNKLIEYVKKLNDEISADPSLKDGFCIGHSYFCGQNECTDEWLSSIVNNDILPMLREYWFDDMGRFQRWKCILCGVLT